MTVLMTTQEWSVASTGCGLGVAKGVEAVANVDRRCGYGEACVWCVCGYSVTRV